MPVALLKHHFLRRDSTGLKAYAHAAYLSGTKLDDGYGHTADFTPKGGILHAELWVPKEAPTWAKDRGQLWKRLEAREDKTTRKAKAILAHKFIGALPHELPLEENILFIKDFIREQFTRRGYAADWAIHAPDPGSDSRNFHVHIMVPLRKFENGDWARTKDRFPKNSPALSLYIKEKQGAFFHLQNRYLKKNGFSPQITRSDGKWIVVETSCQTTSADSRGVGVESPHVMIPTALSAWPAPSARRADVKASPAVTRSAPAPNFGGGNEAQARRRTLGRYTGIVRQHCFSNPDKKGWPEGAIRDWNLWGHKNPPKFFALWPECSAVNPTPGGDFV